MNPGTVHAIQDPIRIVNITVGYGHRLTGWRLEDMTFYLVLVMIFVSLMFDRIIKNILTKPYR